jgi:hypothetical protein
MSIQLNQINLQNEFNEFIDIDTSNQQIASNSIIKIVTIVKDQLTQPFDQNKIYLQVMLLLSEIIKEVENISNIHKSLSGKDKKQIAIYLGFTILKELYSNNSEIFQSYVKIYKDNVEPFLEVMLSVSKVVNVSINNNNKTLFDFLCPCISNSTK